MPNQLLTLLAAIVIAGLSMQSLAVKGGEKGPSDQAYEHASDNASFKRDRDEDDDDDKKKHKKKDKDRDVNEDDWGRDKKKSEKQQ